MCWLQILLLLMLLLCKSTANISQVVIPEPRKGIPVADIPTLGCPDLETSVGYGNIAPKTFNFFFLFHTVWGAFCTLTKVGLKKHPITVPGICVCGALIAEIGLNIYHAFEQSLVSYNQWLGKKYIQHKFSQFSSRLWVYWILTSAVFFGFFLLVPGRGANDHLSRFFESKYRLLM